MSTCGTPCSRPPSTPATFAYQGVECSTSHSATASAISRSTASVCSAALAIGHPGRHRVGDGIVARGAEAVHVDLDQAAQPRTRKSTCTPAPP